MLIHPFACITVLLLNCTIYLISLYSLTLKMLYMSPTDHQITLEVIDNKYYLSHGDRTHEMYI